MAGDDSPKDGKGMLHPEGIQVARDMAAGVVHEINNTLGVIIGNAHLAKRSLSNRAALEKYLGEIREAAEEGRELMRQLGMFASQESARIRVVSLNDLVTEATSAFQSQVTLDLSSKDPAVELDLWLAQDAARSLVGFMLQASSVSTVRVATRVVGNAVALTFEDDGSNLSDKELRTLFIPLVRAERRPQAGVGLTKLVDLASRCGGHVTASNRDPNGLRIVLTLPVAAEGASGDGPGVPLPQQGV